eukprot:3028629-Pyramimonas_sp.AAC.1
MRYPRLLEVPRRPPGRDVPRLPSVQSGDHARSRLRPNHPRPGRPRRLDSKAPLRLSGRRCPLSPGARSTSIRAAMLTWGGTAGQLHPLSGLWVTCS